MSSFAPLTLLCSDEPLLKNDRADALMQQARKAMPEANLIIFTHSDFQSPGQANLARLENELRDPGLFGAAAIMRIYLKDLDKTAVEVLNLIAKRMRPGLCIIAELPRITAALVRGSAAPSKSGKSRSGDAAKKEALANFKRAGGQIEMIYPPDSEHLPWWIANRAQQRGLTLELKAAQYLALAGEGNLTAIDQALQIMQMTAVKGRIDAKSVENYFSADSRRSGFELCDAILSAQCERALAIISSGLNSDPRALALMISRLDLCLNAVSTVKEQHIQAGRTSALYALGIRLPSQQRLILEAAGRMSSALLAYLTRELAAAAHLYSCFDQAAAIRALQRMAAAVRFPAAARLQPL